MRLTKQSMELKDKTKKEYTPTNILNYTTAYLLTNLPSWRAQSAPQEAVHEANPKEHRTKGWPFQDVGLDRQSNDDPHRCRHFYLNYTENK
jgi:hypothetical protein